MSKRFTFADAKARIKELEADLAKAKNLDTSDNIYTSEENEEIKFLKKSTSIKSWFYYLLWSFIPFISIKWAIFGSKRFPWAQPSNIIGLIFGITFGIIYWIAFGPMIMNVFGNM